jgi:Spy/CpxP family protein refolding chaperone
MKRGTATTLSMILVMATVFLSSGIAAAQGFGGRGGGSLVPSQRLLERLGITDPVHLEGINQLVEDGKAALGALQEEQKEFRQQLRTLLESEDPDPTEVGNRVIWSRNVGADIRTVREGIRAEFEASLTADQLTAWEEFNSNRQRRRGSHRGFRGDREGSPEGF